MSDESLQFGKPLAVSATPIPGLLVFDLPVHGDPRGWFKENWQRSKMIDLGLPEIGPVQNNISFNAQRGVTRGIHAEPWDKYISVGSGKIFGAWVDLREGDTFGATFTTELDPTKAIFVPRGVGNSFQALEDNTVYIYLVNDHWTAESQSLYTFLNLADETAAIDWPIPLNKAELSDKDKSHPRLSEVKPMKSRNILVTGADTKVGKALESIIPELDYVTRDEFDPSSDDILALRSWRQYDIIINLSQYANIDGAETTAGREKAWRDNVNAVSNLAKVASANILTLVHLSADYIYDGEESSYDEDVTPSPLNVYGQTKAAAESVVKVLEKHYIIRTGWVIGQGPNFVDTMLSYAADGLSPRVVNDQHGRLTFADDIARFIELIVNRIRQNDPIPYGVYNLTGDGTPTTWAEIAKKVFEHSGRSADDVQGISTKEYEEENPGVAYRPANNILQLDRVKFAGFTPPDWERSLAEYLKKRNKKKDI